MIRLPATPRYIRVTAKGRSKRAKKLAQTIEDFYNWSLADLLARIIAAPMVTQIRIMDDSMWRIERHLGLSERRQSTTRKVKGGRP